jgi:hypothetical protein
MKFVSEDELEQAPEDVARLALREEIVLTAEGKPFAMLLGIGEGGIEETIELVREVKARRALARLRQQAGRQGLDRMPAREIALQIREVRRAKRKRK